MESTARLKNGAPHHSTTGVASSNCAIWPPRPERNSGSGRPSMGPMVMTSSGTVSSAPTMNRRVKSRSSASSSSAAGAEPAAGSSAMPQMGQSPGASSATSGWQAQTHLAPAGAACAASGCNFAAKAWGLASKSAMLARDSK